MYIHNYQIHNVLDIYRKQLSQGTQAGGRYQAPATRTDHKVPLPGSSTRPDIIDRVSAQIVNRLVGEKPGEQLPKSYSQKYFGTANQLSFEKETQFTFTAIDENDHKRTNTLSVGQLNPMLQRTGSQAMPTHPGDPETAP